MDSLWSPGVSPVRWIGFSAVCTIPASLGMVSPTATRSRSMNTWKWPLCPDVSPSAFTILILDTSRAMVAVLPETTVAVGALESCSPGDGVGLGDGDEAAVGVVAWGVEPLHAPPISTSAPHTAAIQHTFFTSFSFVRCPPRWQHSTECLLSGQLKTFENSRSLIRDKANP